MRHSSIPEIKAEPFRSTEPGGEERAENPPVAGGGFRGGGAEVVLVQRTMKGGLKLGCKWEVATPRAWCEVANTSSEPSVPGRLGIHQTVR